MSSGPLCFHPPQESLWLPRPLHEAGRWLRILGPGLITSASDARAHLPHVWLLYKFDYLRYQERPERKRQRTTNSLIAYLLHSDRLLAMRCSFLVNQKHPALMI